MGPWHLLPTERADREDLDRLGGVRGQLTQRIGGLATVVVAERSGDARPDDRIRIADVGHDVAQDVLVTLLAELLDRLRPHGGLRARERGERLIPGAGAGGARERQCHRQGSRGERSHRSVGC